MSQPTPAPEMPKAVGRRPNLLPALGWFWLVPVASAALAGGLIYMQWSARGVPLTLQFPQGHGLKPGDGLRHKGITVGQVRSVTLSHDLLTVSVQVDLQRSAENLARAGSRFWVVHPQVDLTGVGGLETLLGANYIAVHPGPGERQREFIGLERPPILETFEPGGLEIVLQADRVGGLRPGVPLLYRQVRIGSVLSVSLASDASAVEARAYVRPEYRRLIRKNTQFANVSGAKLEGGLTTGFNIGIDSLETLLTGGVTLATPNRVGDEADAGERFRLLGDPPRDWQQWRPSLPLDPSLPLAADLPRPVFAAVSYRRRGILANSAVSFQGWALPLPDGSLASVAEMATVPADAVADGDGLAEGIAFKVPRLAAGAPAPRLARVRAAFTGRPVPWERLRTPTGPEDVVLVTDLAADNRRLAAARFTATPEGWAAEPAEQFDDRWRGALAVAAADGKVVGMLHRLPRGAGVVVPWQLPALPAE